MSPQTTTHHTVSFLTLPGGQLIQAPKGHKLRVTVTCEAEDNEDPLLRDVGRPNWPHRATT